MAQTSDRVSKLAGKYINLTAAELIAKMGVGGRPGAEIMASEIRTLAASALRQDERRGLAITRAIKIAIGLGR